MGRGGGEGAGGSGGGVGAGGGSGGGEKGVGGEVAMLDINGIASVALIRQHPNSDR